MKVIASRWPWQDSGKKAALVAPLNPRGARFGGGWSWCLGIRIGARTIYLELGWGVVRIEL